MIENTVMVTRPVDVLIVDKLGVRLNALKWALRVALGELEGDLHVELKGGVFDARQLSV